MKNKFSIQTLHDLKRSGTRITALTAYDYLTARMLDRAGMDLILVGDSLGMVIQGQPTTLAVTLDEMIYHTRIVSRAVETALLVADMPYGTFHVSAPLAVENALRLVKEGGCDAVKIEGGRKRLTVIRAILDAEIPVMGHLGLTPQSVHHMGGFKVQGKQMPDIEAIIDDALALQKEGCFALVLEGIPHSVAKIITRLLDIPTIGIGAGPDCDGQILVFQDMMGLAEGSSFRFVRKYAQLFDILQKALNRYQQDVREGSFPSMDESFSLEPDLKTALEKRYGSHFKNK